MFEQALSTPNIARGQKTDNLELFHSLNWASIKPVLSNKAENINWLKSITIHIYTVKSLIQDAPNPQT